MFKNHKILVACFMLAALFASSAKANLLGTSVGCEAIGIPRLCLPNAGEIFNTTFVLSDDNDPLFTITGGETAITLTMDGGVTGNELDGTGFRLIGLTTVGSGSFIAPIEPGDVEFLGDWSSLPTSLPVVSGDQPGQMLEWTTLAGADPIGDAAIRINLTFDTAPIPVPAAVWLFGSGLLGLIGIAKRKKA